MKNTHENSTAFFMHMQKKLYSQARKTGTFGRISFLARFTIRNENGREEAFDSLTPCLL